MYNCIRLSRVKNHLFLSFSTKCSYAYSQKGYLAEGRCTENKCFIHEIRAIRTNLPIVWNTVIHLWSSFCSFPRLEKKTCAWNTRGCSQLSPQFNSWWLWHFWLTRISNEPHTYSGSSSFPSTIEAECQIHYCYYSCYTSLCLHALRFHSVSSDPVLSSCHFQVWHLINWQNDLLANVRSPTLEILKLNLMNSQLISHPAILCLCLAAYLTYWQALDTLKWELFLHALYTVGVVLYADSMAGSMHILIRFMR